VVGDTTPKSSQVPPTPHELQLRKTQMAAPNTPHALAVGEMIEEFRIIRILGAGGFGIVYECRNTHLPETAAIKEFRQC